MFKNNVEFITLRKENITDFAKERNDLLKRAKAEWVFFVDTDEVISNELKEEVLKAIKDKNFDGYFVTRRDFLYGKELKHGEFSGRGWFGNTKLLRLGRKSSGKWERSVHEYWDVKGKLGTLKSPLLHYPHPDLKSFIGNVDYFSGLHAVALKKEGKRSSLVKIAVWPVGKFVYNFIFRLGFLDGMVGFVVALIMSFHSFLAWSKLQLLQTNSRNA